jgi:hypothetical protein
MWGGLRGLVAVAIRMRSSRGDERRPANLEEERVRVNPEAKPTCKQEDLVCGIHTGCKSGRRGARKH